MLRQQAITLFNSASATEPINRPSITISNLVIIDEGTALNLPFTVNDPDTEQGLTLSLVGNPPGVILNAAAHRLTWPTGEGNGPSTNLLTLRQRRRCRILRYAWAP